MGKRKKASRKPQGSKKSDPLPTVFTCLFCNHEKSVGVKLDRKAGVGHLECKICGQKFQCGINYLSAAVDVYGEWVDAADAVARGELGERGLENVSKRSSSAKGISSGRLGDAAGLDQKDYQGMEIAEGGLD